MTDIAVDISNMATTYDLKEKYAAAANNDEVRADKLRLFYMGRDMKDDQKLYTFKLQSDMTI